MLFTVGSPIVNMIEIAINDLRHRAAVVVR